MQKKSYFCLLSLLSFFLMLNYAEEMNIEKDELLNKFQSALPQEWKFSVQKDQLCLERSGDIWILSENKINAPMSIKTEEEEIARIQKYGQKAKAKMRFRYETKWTEEKIKNTHSENTVIYQKIQELPEKYHIVSLKSKFSKMEPVFIAETEEDDQKIKAYYEEKVKLEESLQKLPDYHTSLYSLFTLSVEGQEDEFHTVSPKTVSAEIYSIQNKMTELLH